MLFRVLLLVSFFASLATAQGADVAFSPYTDPEARVLALLDQAQSSVEVAHYNIRSQPVFDKLSELRNRGVRVRIVVDAKNAAKPWNLLDDAFEAAGFDILRYRNTRSPYAIMHHKFCVIDGAVVVTGSFNWSATARLVNDENMIVLRDTALAQAYQAEFEELRGAPERAGPGVGASATVHFAPEDRPRGAILAAIRAAQRRIRVAVFSFRDRDVARALRDAARRGVEVTLVTERKQANTTSADETVASGGARVIVAANQSSAFSAMHHKFCVIDDQIVITGASNWTYTAFEHSNEDVLEVHDPQVAQAYTRAFGALLLRYAPAGFNPLDYGAAQSAGDVHLLSSASKTAWGEQLYAVGDHPAFGSWDPHRGVPLLTTETIFPSWSGRLRLPAGARIEWKLVAIGPGGVVRWETGFNRVLVTDAAGTAQFVESTFREPPAPLAPLAGPAPAAGTRAP